MICNCKDSKVIPKDQCIDFIAKVNGKWALVLRHRKDCPVHGIKVLTESHNDVMSEAPNQQEEPKDVQNNSLPSS